MAAMVGVQQRTTAGLKDRAGYFIRDWQDLRDQVRQMIAKDSRYQSINATRAARRR
jgi:hypothetical protein